MSGNSTAIAKAAAIKQIQLVRNECDHTLASVKAFAPPNPITNQYDPTFRLIATPMLYSIWERAFSICHSESLRLIRDVTVSANSLTADRRAIWLIKGTIFRSFVDRIKTTIHDARTPKKGEFNTLVDFLRNLDSWAAEGLDPALAVEDLVITFSNVNPKVVDLNAEAIGIAAYPQFQTIKFGRLHNLLLYRNEIGHGARIVPPTNQEFVDLMNFTEELVRDYTDVFVAWINAEF